MPTSKQQVTGKDPAISASMPSLVQQHLSFLSRIPARLLAAHDEEELRDLLGSCLRTLFRHMLRFELFVTDESLMLVPVVKLGDGQFGSGLKLLESLRSRLTMREQQGSIVEPHLFASLAGVKRGSLMSAPLLDNGALIGLLVVEAAAGSMNFTGFDLDLFEGLASLFSLALQRLRAKELEQTQMRMDLDLKTASKVQRRFMCASLPPEVGVTAYTEYLPAFDVGGDFYDLVTVDGAPGCIGAVIGDVSGKGVSAALVMSRVSMDFRRALATSAGPAAILKDVNDGLRDDESEIFVTACCLKLDARQRVARVANAGHIPIIVRRVSGEVFTFGPPSATPLGMIAAEYEEEELDLGPLDIVLLMTDGLVEALDRPSDRMGLQLLLGLIKYAPHDPRLIHSRILEAVQKMKGAKLLDDCTLVALQIEP